ncbi:hypothetical protein FOL47_006415 [Perkinsus chesapeaki]|uniref:Uncharacterized protein n=1 Tax=Perkinsus chesapeaki TaxID=330153 RepID=A0A7J6LRY0_PERCH|nr:hypothetical protein FOL47_006415 [Perkinsus chesapeaki]
MTSSGTVRKRIKNEIDKVEPTLSSDVDDDVMARNERTVRRRLSSLSETDIKQKRDEDDGGYCSSYFLRLLALACVVLFVMGIARFVLRKMRLAYLLYYKDDFES